MLAINQYVLRALSVVALATVATACDDDNSESGDIPEPFHFSSLKIPFDNPNACIESAAKKHGESSTLTSCRCEKCLDLMQECEAVTGCMEIVACANRSGCTNEFTCYLLPGAPCMEVIDRYGNSSLATAITVNIQACTTANACR